MGEGIFAGLPLSLNGVRKLLELMDWGPQGDALKRDGFLRFGGVGAEDVERDDDVFVILAPQSIVGCSIVAPLADMVDAAAGKRVITINARLGDVQSAAGVMSYRGRADRLDFVAAWREVFHFSLVVPIGRTFFPILGAVVRAANGAPYVLYQRVEVADPPDADFPDSAARAAAVKAGTLVEKYRAVGCYAAVPDAKAYKAAFRAALEADRAAGAGG